MKSAIVKLAKSDYEKLEQRNFLMFNPGNAYSSFEEDQIITAQLDNDSLKQLDCYVYFMGDLGEHENVIVINRCLFKN